MTTIHLGHALVDARFCAWCGTPFGKVVFTTCTVCGVTWAIAARLDDDTFERLKRERAVLESFTSSFDATDGPADEKKSEAEPPELTSLAQYDHHQAEVFRYSIDERLGRRLLVIDIADLSPTVTTLICNLQKNWSERKSS